MTLRFLFKTVFYPIIILVVLVSCDQNKTIKIKGEVKFATREYLVFGKLNPDVVRILDTVYLKDLRYFEFKVNVDTPDYYTIDFGSQIVNLLLTEYDLEIEIDGNSPFGKGKIIGSPEEDMLMDFRNFLDSLNMTDRYLSIKSSTRQAIIDKNERKKDSLLIEGNKWRTDKHVWMIDFLSKYPINFGHLQGMTVMNDSIAKNYKQEVFSQLLKKYPTSRNVNYAAEMFKKQFEPS